MANLGRRFAASLSVLTLGLAASGCGGGVDAVAEKNRTFYAYDSASQEMLELFETPYPPLDLAGAPPRPEYRGVSVLNGHVHISKPTDWVLRKAGNEPGHRFVQYISPNQYVFAVYEWPDHPDAPWREVLTRFEDAAKASRAELVESRVPMANWNTQARAYVVKRRVPGAKHAFVNTSLEMLARNERGVVLVQIVHQGDTLGTLTDPLLRVVETLQLD